jgi:integrase/recombinase XerD
MSTTTPTRTKRPRRKTAFTPDPDGYLAWKKQPGQQFADKTEAKYMPAIRSYWAYCRKEKVPVSRQDVCFIEMEWFEVETERFKAKYQRQPSPSYLRNRYVALKSYFDFLERLGVVSVNPLKLITRPVLDYGEVDWLTEAEDEALAAVEMDPLEEILWALARVAGLRISEIPDLLDEDVDLLANEIHVRDGKTRAAKRDVLILPRLRPAIERWRAHRDELYGDPANNASFIRTGRARVETTVDRPKHISTVYIDRLLKRVATRAGVRLHRDKDGNPIALDKAGHNTSAVSAHVLRRTYGCDLLNRGASIHVLSAQLGHAHIGVTQQAYARLLKKTVRDEVLGAIEGGITSLSGELASTRRKLKAVSKRSAKQSREHQLGSA